jgi:hypothetical protein
VAKNQPNPATAVNNPAKSSFARQFGQKDRQHGGRVGESDADFEQDAVEDAQPKIALPMLPS